MATTLFINRTDLVKNTILNGNVDTDVFINFIKIAQQMHVQQYLGTQLYNKITSLINAGTMTEILNPNYYLLLVEYIQPILIHFSMTYYLPFANFKITNGGVFKHKSDSSDSVSGEELELLVQKHRTFADFYAKRFVDYANFYATTLFPEYWLNKNNDIYPDSQTNPCNWLL